MAITREDIKLLESEKMTDYEDGGGHMTGRVVVDGQLNNIFPSISELDLAYGRVRMRKVFAVALDDSDDAYYGAHVVIDRRPSDPLIDCLLFSTGSWSDQRTDARDAIERYVTAGPVSGWFLYDVQVEGQRSILLFGRT